MSHPLADAHVAKPLRIEWLLYAAAGMPAASRIRRSKGIKLLALKPLSERFPQRSSLRNIGPSTIPDTVIQLM
ncbi:hypothetical protein D3C76_1786360 [compost metagenome]